MLTLEREKTRVFVKDQKIVNVVTVACLSDFHLCEPVRRVRVVQAMSRRRNSLILFTGFVTFTHNSVSET